MKQDSTNINIHQRLLIFTIVLVILASVLISYYALSSFENKLEPELNLKAKTIGESINSLIVTTLDYGIPIGSLEKVDTYLLKILDSNPELKYIAVTNLEGKVEHDGGTISESVERILFTKPEILNSKDYNNLEFEEVVDNWLPIRSEKTNEIKGFLHVGVDKKFVQKNLQEMLYDVLTVVIISFLIAFELVVFLVTYTVSSPIDSLKKNMIFASSGDFSKYITFRSDDEIGRFVALYNNLIKSINEAYQDLINKVAPQVQEEVHHAIERLTNRYRFGFAELPKVKVASRLGYIRPALFLLIFSESLSLSFFPLFVKEINAANPSGISSELVVGLPISIFMLFWALSLAPAGAWSDRIGRRKPFLIGAIVTAVGLMSTSFVVDVYQLLVVRSFTALGYGVVFISAQGYIIDNTSPNDRSKGMAMFLAGFFAGSLSGSAIGGILAHHIGYEATFRLSGFLSLISAGFVFYFIYDRHGDRGAKKKLKLEYFKLLFSNTKFLSIILFTAIPAKICLVGFLYYMGPIFLKELNVNQSGIGRVLMTYGLAIIFFAPLTAKLADKLKNRSIFVVVGGLLSASALLLVFFWQDLYGIAVAIFLVGVGHSIGVSSQLTLITEVCREEGEKIGLGTVVGIFRLLERIGNIIGPIVVASFIAIAPKFVSIVSPILDFFSPILTSLGSNPKLEEPYYPVAVAGIGIITFVGTVLFTLLFTLTGFKRKAVKEELFHYKVEAPPKEEKVVVEETVDEIRVEPVLEAPKFEEEPPVEIEETEELVDKQPDDYIKKVNIKLDEIASLYQIGFQYYFDGSRYVGSQFEERFKKFLYQADDSELIRINPYYLSKKLHVNPSLLMNYLVYAVSVGLFDFNWLIHCPSCNNVVEDYYHIDEIKSRTTCSSCNKEFNVYFDELIEVVFNMNRLIKEVDLNTGENSELDQRVSGLECIHNSVFQELFPHELINPNEQFQIKKVALLYTTFENGVEIGLLHDSCEEFVKYDSIATVRKDNSILATFHIPEDGFTTSLDMLQYWKNRVDTQTIKMTIDQGSAILVNLNDQHVVKSDTIKLLKAINKIKQSESEPIVFATEQVIHDSKIRNILLDIGINKLSFFKAIFQYSGSLLIYKIPLK